MTAYYDSNGYFRRSAPEPPPLIKPRKWTLWDYCLALGGLCWMVLMAVALRLA